MGFAVVFPAGVGYRNSPSYEDRRPGSGPLFGTVVSGQAVQGDRTTYVNVNGGFLPMQTATGQTILVTLNTVHTFQINSQVELRRSCNFEDRIGGSVSHGQVIQGQVCGGSANDAYIYTPQGYIPLLDKATAQPLCTFQDPGAPPPAMPQYAPPPGPPPMPQYAPPQASPATGYAPPPPPQYSGNAPPPPPPSGFGAPPPPPDGGKREQAIAAFRRFDTDRSRSIDLNEFKLALRQLGFHGSDDDIACIFCVVDVDGDMQVTENEFV